jgi:hypothetical protein
MNSSLRRFCNSRARLLHRSKDLEQVVLKGEDGSEFPTGVLRVSKAKGTTFNAGFNRLKRAAPGVLNRALKDRVWHGNTEA